MLSTARDALRPAAVRGDPTRRARRLDILRRAGLFGECPEGVTVRPACRPGDFESVFGLVHDAFVEKGYILPQASGLRVRVYEVVPDMATFLAAASRRTVGAISILSDSTDLGLPSEEAFRVEIDQLRTAGSRLCEATNQAMAPELRHSAATTELMRCSVACALAQGFDEILACVSPSHEGFYGLMGFRKVGAVRSYSPKVDDPVVLLSLDLHDLRAAATGVGDEVREFMHRFLVSENPYLPPMEGWLVLARHVFRRPEALRDLFVIRSGLLGRCSPAEREAIRRRWGSPVFAAVMGTGVPTDGAPAGTWPPRLRREVAPLAHGVDQG